MDEVFYSGVKSFNNSRLGFSGHLHDCDDVMHVIDYHGI